MDADAAATSTRINFDNTHDDGVFADQGTSRDSPNAAVDVTAREELLRNPFTNGTISDRPNSNNDNNNDTVDGVGGTRVHVDDVGRRASNVNITVPEEIEEEEEAAVEQLDDAAFARRLQVL